MSKYVGIMPDIQCPFFISLRNRTIVCESPVHGADTTSTFFATESRRASHIIWCCREKDGGRCPVYRAIAKKYDDKNKPDG